MPVLGRPAIICDPFIHGPLWTVLMLGRGRRVVDVERDAVMCVEGVGGEGA
jgi:hypothetical protein